MSDINENARFAVEIIALKSENVRLRQIAKDNNPFCGNCKEQDCVVSMDGTCAMIRVYLNAKRSSNESQH